MAERIVTPSFARTDHRGTFVEAINRGQWEALIYGRMKKDAVLGNHYHKRTEIFFVLTRGRALVRTVHVPTGEREEFPLEADQGVLLPVWHSHAIRFLEDGEFIMLKSLRYDPAEPDTFPYPVGG